jgi:hypothetical protein
MLLKTVENSIDIAAMAYNSSLQIRKEGVSPAEGKRSPQTIRTAERGGRSTSARPEEQGGGGRGTQPGVHGRLPEADEGNEVRGSSFLGI